MTDFTIRPVTSEEYPAFVEAFIDGFGDDLPSEGFPELVRSTLPPERTLAVFEGPNIVATFGGYALDVTIPGGSSLPMEGTTVVTVFPTHRRMGMLRDMMTAHLENAVGAGYAIAGLWASESGIYGRFGYGIATQHRSYTLSGPSITMRPGVVVDRVRRITQDNALEAFRPVFDRVLRTRPGMYARSEAWWTNEVLPDEEWMRRGRTKRRYIVHDGANGVDGYAMYRQKSGESDDGHPNGKVDIGEILAETPQAFASLWAYLTRIDLSPNVEAWNTPIDDPLPALVTEPRRVRTTRVSDALWIRILDVPTALEARAYEEDGEVTFEVVDAFRPSTSGTYTLIVEDGSGRAQRTATAPSVSVDVDVLGALYLGGGDAMAHAAAGRLRGNERDVELLHRLMRTVRQPWCNQVF